MICTHKELAGILQTGVRDTRTRPDPQASTLFKISGFDLIVIDASCLNHTLIL